MSNPDMPVLSDDIWLRRDHRAISVTYLIELDIKAYAGPSDCVRTHSARIIRFDSKLEPCVEIHPSIANLDVVAVRTSGLRGSDHITFFCDRKEIRDASLVYPLRWCTQGRAAVHCDAARAWWPGKRRTRYANCAASRATITVVLVQIPKETSQSTPYCFRYLQSTGSVHNWTDYRISYRKSHPQ